MIRDEGSGELISREGSYWETMNDLLIENNNAKKLENN